MNNILKMKNKISNWNELKLFLRKRSLSPLKYPSFVLYFIFVIILMGSIGVLNVILSWISNGDLEITDFISNASNVFLALVAASAVELILIKDDDLESDTQCRKIDIRILGIIFLIIAFFLWILAKHFSNYIGLIISIIGLFFGFYVWWISNAQNSILIDETDPKHALAGDTIMDNEIKGDIKDFKS